MPLVSLLSNLEIFSRKLKINQGAHLGASVPSMYLVYRTGRCLRHYILIDLVTRRIYLMSSLIIGLDEF